ncbi:redoxin domain-containing protein [Brevundimonas sp. TWP2-3-4b1]|uniref:redoxin domain-containing protein n=1 Tax=Brevundimonas sp. TWP2-3-4b1 TaxID=2804580 RepID=UPI003CF9C84C
MARLPILAAALLTLAACQQAEAPATAPATGATPAVATTGRAQLAPAFTLIDSEGVARSLADFRAKTVVIEWTNEGCPYVQKHSSSGAMQALRREAVADGVIWLTVISSAPGKQGHVEGEGARAWRTRNNAASTHLLLDPEETVGKAYGAMTTPDMRVIDGEGRILFAGGIDDRPTNTVEDLEGANNFVRAALDDVEAGRGVRTAYAPPYGCSIKYPEEA